VLVRTYQCPVKSLTSGAGGGGGWVYLRGDRQDPAALGVVELR